MGRTPYCIECIVHTMDLVVAESDSTILLYVVWTLILQTLLEVGHCHSTAPGDHPYHPVALILAILALL